MRVQQNGVLEVTKLLRQHTKHPFQATLSDSLEVELYQTLLFCWTSAKYKYWSKSHAHWNILDMRVQQNGVLEVTKLLRRHTKHPFQATLSDSLEVELYQTLLFCWTSAKYKYWRRYQRNLQKRHRP